MYLGTRNWRRFRNLGGVVVIRSLLWERFRENEFIIMGLIVSVLLYVIMSLTFCVLRF